MKTFILIILWSNILLAAKTLEIKIIGKNQEALQKKADFDMVSSTKYCRGELIAFPTSSWECQEESCVRKYICKNISKEYSRFTEIPRLRKALVKDSEGTIVLPKEEKKIFLDHHPPKPKKIKVVTSPPPSNPLPAREEKFEEDALSLLDDESRGKNMLVKPLESQMDQDITYQDLTETKPVQESPFKKGEAKWKLIKTTSREKGMKRYELEKILDSSARFQKKISLLNLAVGLLGVSSQETSLSSFYIGWVPRWELSPLWSVRGEIGLQYFTQEYYDSNDVLVSTNSFLLSPYALYLNYYGSFYFLEIGGGFQWWYGQKNEFNPMLAIGFGYRIPDTFFTLDRISLNYDYVSANMNLSELKLSFTFLLL